MKPHFEWDPEKAAKNTQKHLVDFDEASTIFDDPQFITFLDEDHSIDEERYITLGLSNQNRLLMVAHTERNENIRIISARKATRYETRFYEDAG
jgi:uncharacterized DUF497 family protein